MPDSLPIKPPSNPAFRPAIPLLFLLIGIGIGVAIAVTLMQRKEEENLVRRDDSVLAKTPAGLATPPTAKEISEREAVKISVSPVPYGPPEPPLEKTPDPTQALPTRLGGKLPSGEISGGPGTGPMSPIVVERDKPAGPTGAYVEFNMLVAENEVEPLAGRVKQLVRGAGGQVLLEFRYEPDRPEVGTEIVISVPKAKASKLEADLRSAGAAEIDRWTGPISERGYRMGRFLRDRLEVLNLRMKELRVRFLSDAPDVIWAKESIERYEKAIAWIKPPPREMAGLKVFIGRS